MRAYDYECGYESDFECAHLYNFECEAESSDVLIFRTSCFFSISGYPRLLPDVRIHMARNVRINMTTNVRPMTPNVQDV